jgi:hypothetical protein
MSRLKTSGSFKKGESKGKPKGALNRTTKEAKELLDNILFGRIDSINDTLDKLEAKDPARYIEAVTRLLVYVLPKKTDVTTGGDKVNITFTRNGGSRN